MLAGDLAESVDFAPNVQQRAVHTVLKERMDGVRADFDSLMNSALPAFNGRLQERRAGGVIVSTLGD